jgi:hypothetical protein
MAACPVPHRLCCPPPDRNFVTVGKEATAGGGVVQRRKHLPVYQIEPHGLTHITPDGTARFTPRIVCPDLQRQMDHCITHHAPALMNETRANKREMAGVLVLSGGAGRPFSLVATGPRNLAGPAATVSGAL